MPKAVINAKPVLQKLTNKQTRILKKLLFEASQNAPEKHALMLFHSSGIIGYRETAYVKKDKYCKYIIYKLFTCQLLLKYDNKHKSLVFLYYDGNFLKIPLKPLVTKKTYNQAINAIKIGIL